MTQAPYYPNQQPQPAYGQQPGYGSQPAYGQQPGYGYPDPNQQQVPQQGYPAQPMQPQYQQPQTGYPAQQQAPQQLANGSLDDYYAQPTTGGGPGVSWKGKPDGYTVQGVVPRDVTDGDVSQEVGAPNTQNAGQPQFYRDGRPKYVMAVPLQMAPSQEFLEGEARLFVRGQLKDELARAMSEAQVPEKAPVAGATITATLVERKQGRGAIPQNVFRVVYTPAGHVAPQVLAGGPQQGYQQQAPQQFAPQQVQQPQQGYAQPVQQQAPAVHQGAVAPSPAPAPQVAQQVQQPPVQQGQPVQQAPQGMTPEQQALFSQLAGQQGAQQA